MSQYIKLSTLEFPRHEGDIRLEHPEILESQTGDTFPCPPTYAPVEFIEPPIVSDVQTCEPAPPVQDAQGNWKMAWTVRDLTASELADMAKQDSPINLRPI